MITLPAQPWKEGDQFTVEETGVVFTYDSEKWLASVESDDEATAEEKRRRLAAIWQYRGMLELDEDGKPIADWDALNADGEWGEAELGGWFAHSTEPPKYGRWKIADMDWLWIQPSQMSWDNESESWRGMDTSRMVPKNVGDTFTIDINEINVDVWNGDEIYVWGMPARFEFRVEEIFYPKSPAGNDQSYAPMIRVSLVRDEDHYRFWLPETPLYGDAINGYDLLVDIHPSAVNVTTNDLYATKEDLEAIDIPDADLGPVEERLDAIEEVLPKVPLIIDPVDIGPKTLIDYAGRPSGSEKPPEGDAWIWHLDAGRTGSPANEIKLLIPNDKQNNIDLQATTIWFKQGDRVQKWNCDFGGWYTGGNCLHISCTSNEGDDLVDGQPFEIYYIDPNATGDDLIDVISRMESKADDRKLQAEIEVLSGQLSTLVKSQEDGEWTYKGELPEVPRQPGEFILATATLTSEMNSVYLQETDLGGITHNFNAPVGSYIEIVDEEEPMDYVLFEVTDEPQGTGLIQIDVKMVKAGNAFELDDRCIIRFFEVTDALDINELDNRYLQLAGGTMRGDIRFDGPRQILSIDGDGQASVQLKIGTETEYVGQYSSDDAIATKKRLKDYVPIAGGTMTGALTAPRVNVKNTEFGDGVLLVEGKRDNTTNVAARVTFSNSQNANAYGSIEWYATNGSNGQFKFGNKVLLKKPPQTNADGFTIKGYIDGSEPNGDLLKVYHNANAQDAILYKGKQVDTEDHLATTKWVVGKIGAIDIPESSKSIATAQMMMQPHSYWDMSGGKFTLVQQDGTSPTLSPTGAYGFRCYPHPDEWFVESHEFIVGGYISILDPYSGKVQFAGRVESLEKDLSAANRWTFMMTDRYQWGDNFNSGAKYLVTLTGCLREA
jgi:hypothetical protein